MGVSKPRNSRSRTPTRAARGTQSRRERRWCSAPSKIGRSSNALGALLTFTSRPLYQTCVQVPRIRSVSARERQQLGGLIMRLLGGMFWMVALVIVLTAFLRHGDEAVTH